MNSSEFRPGDILKATHRQLTKGYHPIIYVRHNSGSDFIGAMLTHHNDADRNVKMKAAYFKKPGEFANTYLVKAKFIKPESWGPFKKFGELTPEGIKFVMDTIQDLPRETFAKYFARHKEDE